VYCLLDVGKHHWFGDGGVKNPSPDNNLLAQSVAPAIHIQHSISVLHELKPTWRLDDALDRGIAGQTR
jgi:hypothetical protein